jgi:hypothetical protein
MKLPDSIVLSVRKVQKNGLIIYKYLSHNSPSLIKKSIHFNMGTAGAPHAVACEVAYKYRLEFELL